MKKLILLSVILIVGCAHKPPSATFYVGMTEEEFIIDNEIIELNLDDDFLRNNMEEDFSLFFNSKEANNKITFTSPYLKGYLAVAY